MPNVDEMMKEMEREFMKLKDIEAHVPKELVREKKLSDGSVTREIGPIVYGYSMTIGPDGRPVIRQFGNVKKGGKTPWNELTDKREPLVDMVETDKEVRVLAEVPGVGKEEINVLLEGNKLTLSVNTEKRKYYKELELPEGVQPDSAKSTYNNGILEITLSKQPSGRRGVRLKVD
jgi:HSP20 family protein